MGSLCRSAIHLLVFVFFVLSSSSSSARAKGSSPLLIEEDGGRRKNEPAGKFGTYYFFNFKTYFLIDLSDLMVLF